MNLSFMDGLRFGLGFALAFLIVGILPWLLLVAFMMPMLRFSG